MIKRGILKQKKNFVSFVTKKWDSSDIIQNQTGKLRVSFVEDVGMSTKQRTPEMKFFTKIPCNKCDLRFKSQEELMQHLQITHYKDLPYDCKECGENFSNMEDMRTHLQRQHSYKKDRV
jgi:KRAB domain-containing zinc finger protein